MDLGSLCDNTPYLYFLFINPLETLLTHKILAPRSRDPLSLTTNPNASEEVERERRNRITDSLFLSRFNLDLHTSRSLILFFGIDLQWRLRQQQRQRRHLYLLKLLGMLLFSSIIIYCTSHLG
ncbi:hypothetical protein L6452_04049 [Arctium lappa]|uniref:Uncharacterized protein n=1 Tax=Arctium lappa TaxID=4217 RepID=A0ACB9FPX8_ARCLA|nr:hypothetical protein L6452_04049 [Arctium lappa]